MANETRCPGLSELQRLRIFHFTQKGITRGLNLSDLCRPFFHVFRTSEGDCLSNLWSISVQLQRKQTRSFFFQPSAFFFRAQVGVKPEQPKHPHTHHWQHHLTSSQCKRREHPPNHERNNTSRSRRQLSPRVVLAAVDKLKLSVQRNDSARLTNLLLRQPKLFWYYLFTIRALSLSLNRTSAQVGPADYP